MRRLLGIGAILACSVLLAVAQQVAQLDFFAHAGKAEYDYDKNGRADGLFFGIDPALDPAHFQLSLDYQSKYEGLASQRIVFQRSDGAAGWASLNLYANLNAFLKPEVGEAILVRFALRAEGFQNAAYSAFVTTGSRRAYIIHPRSEPTSGWQQFSMVVPVETDAQGRPVFSFTVMIEPRSGAAAGRIWVDDVQAISTRTVMRSNSLPNGLKLAITYLNLDRNGYRYLPDLPFGFVVGAPHVSQVLGRHYSVPHAPYTYFVATLPPQGYRHSGDLYNYDDVEQNHPDWFLLDRNGQRIVVDDYYYVDIGRQDVRERAWQSLRDFMNRCGRPRYVNIDNVDMRVGPDRFGPPNYPTNDQWVQAVIGWFEYVGSRLRNEFGATFIPNVAWSPGFWLRGINGPDAPGVATLPYMGGFLLEHAFTHARANPGETSIANYGTARELNNWRSWALRDRIRLATEYPDKVVILIHTLWLNYPNSQERLRFAIAGSLIVQHDNTYIQLDPRRQWEQYPAGFYPPELLVPLGRWTENYRILNGDLVSGGLFVRNYENGIVVWNPTHDRDFTFTVPRDLYDWDRNLIRAGTVVQIPRQTGHVFYSAPEITMELSPQNAQVLPGQTVQFTVTYRNRGTAPGTNVRVAVPLPQGMTLVGSNPTARLENGQVVWVVPNVPVGGQGTLQFTVRVE
ncbi:MAG: putative glycoside hydrolase [Candidatus Caldarchaeum sp.]